MVVTNYLTRITCFNFLRVEYLLKLSVRQNKFKNSVLSLKYVGSFLRPGIATCEAETSNRKALILSSFFSIFFLAYSFPFPYFSSMVTSVNSTIFEPMTLSRDALSYQACPRRCLGLANKSHSERASAVPALLCLVTKKEL